MVLKFLHANTMFYFYTLSLIQTQILGESSPASNGQMLQTLICLLTLMRPITQFFYCMEIIYHMDLIPKWWTLHANEQRGAGAVGLLEIIFLFL